MLTASGLLAALLAVSSTPSFTQSPAEQKIKVELQKQLGERAKISSVRSTPVAGLYEVAIGNDVVYADASSRYLIQGELIDLKTGINLTEQRSHDLNRVKWSELPLDEGKK
jgi:thiol:disulfide interchange protein DsbC